MKHSSGPAAVEQTDDRPYCDYEGSTYRTDFWVGRGREYEDRVERAALRSLLPARGQCLIDLGAGYGRLADLYGGYERVVLMDRADSQLRQARQGFGGDSRFHFVVADVYALPFRQGAADHVVSVRVLHHLVDVPAALREIARVLAPGGLYIAEFSNKRHLKAMLRYLFRRQRASPFTPEPYEFVPLNFDFHPGWMVAALARAGLRVQARRAVSHFRLNILKRLVPLVLLEAADRALQRLGGIWTWTPSVFVRARKM